MHTLYLKLPPVTQIRKEKTHKNYCISGMHNVERSAHITWSESGWPSSRVKTDFKVWLQYQWNCWSAWYLKWCRWKRNLLQFYLLGSQMGKWNQSGFSLISCWIFQIFSLLLNTVLCLDFSFWWRHPFFISAVNLKTDSFVWQLNSKDWWSDYEMPCIKGLN